MAEFDGRYDNPLVGLYIGVVVETADPDRLGRVRVLIPGVVEPFSAWAFPLGTVGGGSSNRGFFNVPEIGAEVGVMFKEGDVDSPFYLCGAWGIPPGQDIESPAPVVDEADPERVPLIRTLETRFFRITIDDRSRQGEEGEEQGETLTIEDKRSGDGLLIDANLQTGPSVVIQGSAGVVIQTDGIFRVNATAVQINDRVVLPQGKPI